MAKKYEFTEETKRVGDKVLHRIRALHAFSDVEARTLGGWVECEDNLSHEGTAWVYGDAQVYGDTRVCGDAWVYGDARVCEKGAILTITNIGSRNDTTTFCKSLTGEILVACGCFRGNLEEFEKKVKETHGDNKFVQEYRLAIELAKIHIK